MGHDSRSPAFSDKAFCSPASGPDLSDYGPNPYNSRCLNLCFDAGLLHYSGSILLPWIQCKMPLNRCAGGDQYAMASVAAMKLSKFQAAIAAYSCRFGRSGIRSRLDWRNHAESV